MSEPVHDAPPARHDRDDAPPARRDRDDAPARASGWPAAFGLLLAIAGGVGFAVAYVLDANTQWLGGLLALGLAGLGFALAYWGRNLVSERTGVERYPLPAHDPEGRVELGDEIKRDLQVLTRRRLLSVLLLGGAGAVGLSTLFLVGSLGPRPRRQLFETPWAEGTRLITLEGRPVTRQMLEDGGGYIVAFPEGHPGSADGQVAVLRVPEDRLVRAPGREDWSPEGIIAYSRVCTHAGCALGQYQDEDFTLLCPCHQSTFEVLDGGRPSFGPAGRALPQLPLRIEGDGTLVAQSDFTEPIGPGFWNAP
jgi:ubiquinol-cytochrome c reductase iron-sulfur subunit